MEAAKAKSQSRLEAESGMVLGHIGRHGGQDSGEIAAALHMEKAYVDKLVSNLIHSGLVYTKSDTAGTRYVYYAAVRKSLRTGSEADEPAKRFGVPELGIDESDDRILYG